MTTQRSPEEVKKRSDAAWAIRDMWRHVLMEAYELVFAGINPYHEAKNAPRSMDRQFDSTAVGSVVKLTNRLLMELTPYDQDWISIKPGPLLEIEGYPQAEIDRLKVMLSSASKITNLIVNNSPSVVARGQAFMDVVISGMGCLLCLEDQFDATEPVVDQAVSQSEVAIETDERGRVSGVYRKRKIKVRNIEELWDDADVPADIKHEKGTSKDPEIEVLEATYRGKEKGQTRWHYEVFYCRSGKDPIRMVERVYDNNPWTIFRWMVLPGMPYGPGPVLLALPDIRTANRVMEFILQNAALALAGMYMVRDDGVVNMDNIMITPGGMIPVQATGGNMGASIAPLATNREFNVGQIVLEDLRGAIRRQLYDNSLGPERGTPASATEIIQRIREFTQEIGVGAGMLHGDVQSYARSKIEMAIKTGLIKQPMKIDQFTLKVQINAPLAKAQLMAEVENLVNYYEIAVRLAGPQAAMVVAKIEAILIWIAEQMGIPTDLVRSKTELQNMRAEMAAVAANQEAMPSMQQAA